MNPKVAGVMKKVLMFVIFVGIIGAGYGIHMYLAQAKEAPPREEEDESAMVVEVETAKQSDSQVKISAMGTVMPSREVTLFPEVNGKITYCSKKLVPGGRFKKGETVLRIDPKQYNLALSQQQAFVAQAQMDLSMEKGRKAVAEKEWHLIEDEIKPTEQGKRLALREIQLETAEASLAAAQSNLEIAKMNKNRTAIKAPFNALITSKYVDLGQVVGPGSQLLNLVDADAFWIGVSIPVHQLPWIKIPRRERDVGSSVLVKQEISSGLIATYQGHVMKLLGGVDPRGKMAQLIVEVKNPLEPMSTSFEIENGAGSEGVGGSDLSFPLLLEAVVETEIDGPVLQNVVEVPRHAVRGGDKIWVLTDDRTLKIKNVSVLWTKDARAYVKGEIASGDNIITSRVDTPVEGMKLRLEGEDVKADAGTDEKKAEDAPEAKSEGDEAEGTEQSK